MAPENILSFLSHAKGRRVMKRLIPLLRNDQQETILRWLIRVIDRVDVLHSRNDDDVRNPVACLCSMI